MHVDLHQPKNIEDFLIAGKRLAYPPISEYRVCVVGAATDGSLLRGVNLEFLGTTLNETIHGEQTLVAVAHSKQKQLETVYLDAAPCGHCRQFLYEIDNGQINIAILGEEERKLSYYLPNAFGPSVLGISGGMLTDQDHQLKLIDATKRTDFTEVALEFANRSYAPYSKCFAGVAVELKDGRICGGSYLENVAFNPSLSPFHYALSVMRVELDATFEEIKSVELVTTENNKVDHLSPIKRLTNSLNLNCEIRVQLIKE